MTRLTNGAKEDAFSTTGVLAFLRLSGVLQKRTPPIDYLGVKRRLGNRGEGRIPAVSGLLDRFPPELRIAKTEVVPA